MRHRSWSTLALVIVLLFIMLPAQRLAMADDNKPNITMLLLASMSRNNLNVVRTMCMLGKASELREKAYARGETDFPPVIDYCLTAMRHANAKGWALDPYSTTAAQKGLSMTGISYWALLYQTADAGGTSVELDGVTYPLPPGNALDVGYMYGWQEPKEAIPELADVPAEAAGLSVRQVAEQCFAKAPEVSNDHCHAAGRYLGAQVRLESR